MGIAAAFLACLLLFQNPADLFQQAPPGVDEALRGRINKFFQAHVDGKFRAADEVVAEDSKDAFFAADKARCYSFEIVKITYSENFTRASAVVTCEIDFVMPGNRVRVKAPRTTSWKLVDGQWWWYTVPTDYRDTPFGRMHPGPPGPASNPFSSPSRPDVNALMNMVKADKTEVRLRADQPGSAEVTVTNQLPGPVMLNLLFSGFPGLEMALDRKELNKGEAARLSIRFGPRDKVPPAKLVAQIQVQPTGQVIPIRLIFEPAR